MFCFALRQHDDHFANWRKTKEVEKSVLIVFVFVW